VAKYYFGKIDTVVLHKGIIVRSLGVSTKPIVILLANLIKMDSELLHLPAVLISKEELTGALKFGQDIASQEAT